jgi:hypothetical protein
MDLAWKGRRSTKNPRQAYASTIINSVDRIREIKEKIEKNKPWLFPEATEAALDPAKEMLFGLFFIVLLLFRFIIADFPVLNNT